MSRNTSPERARTVPPLDSAALDRLALRYVERFATTRGKLTDYLKRKIRERGWDGPAGDPAAVAERMAGLGYVDDRAFAEARARSLARRGYGQRRVVEALRHARVGAEDSVAALATDDEAALTVALAFARRRRIGPYAATVPDDRDRQRQLGAMLRAGHDFTLSRRIVETPPGGDVESHG
ncbi:RecX family transcriptional regulator [Sphingomonas sp. SUN019]|uniref:regulatory protein RecX n=1 Tax=Sphingomonas sp. SUN019 TaxID=2937788 RepID=UPI002164CB52|nr:RecX family transcriptional regulator [Sphingomonas sp. SUN019]UVO50245.1 RecX family transcriptional regulator [Sphingomonas sp. SUN019]